VREARVVVTDSGGIQRESYWLGTPCITMRGETEWHETLALGANRLLPPSDAERLPSLFAEANEASRDWARDAYGDGSAAERVRASVAELLSGATR
jgi:UDP-GlcNAc3NAcA epimerase